MNKENKTSDKQQNDNDFRADVRQRAISWWNTLDPLTQKKLAKKHRSPSLYVMDAIGLTGREIQEIWQSQHVA